MALLRGDLLLLHARTACPVPTHATGTLLTVSHDRVFLDATVDRILELSAEDLTVYEGGYTDYKVERERRRERVALAIEAQDKHRRRLAADIAMTGRQPQFAEHQANGMCAVKPHMKRLAAKVAKKSTLLHVLCGELEPSSGEVDVRGTVRLLPQTPARLPAGRALLDWFREQTGLPGDEARRLLAHCRMGAEAINRPPGRLSPGERARVHAAAMVGAGADLIALDEPTNHLDFDTLEVIEAALRAYRGTLVIASHDTELLDAVECDRVIEIKDGGIAGRMTAFRYAIAPAMGLLLAVPATSQAAGIACGSTITSHTKLRADLTDCPGDGLVIGADGVTLDLGRRTIDGTGNGAGIRLAGRRNVTIKGGTVREFATGVALENTSGSRVSSMAVRAVAGRGLDVTGGAGNSFERVVSEGNRTGLALTDSTRNIVRGGTFTSNAVTGVLLFGATHNRVELNRIAHNVGNGVAVVEGADDNAVAGNAVDGSQTGLIVDAAHRNLLSLNRVVGAGDGVLVAGDANGVVGNLVDRSVGGCETCSGWGIGVTSGAGNIVKANLVRRSLNDGIHVDAPGTWIGLNLALRNGDWGIEAVPGVRDGGGNRAFGNAAACSGVRCVSAPGHGGGHRKHSARTRPR